jgi:hypothetical protein
VWYRDLSIVCHEESDGIVVGFGIRDVWDEWELNPERGERFRGFGR